MEIKSIDICSLKLLETTENKEIYDLNNGYILKRYINLSEKTLNIYKKN